MLPGDRLICAFTAPRAVGTTFKVWFLHVTIVPWFRLPDNSEQIAASLQIALTSITPFEVRVGAETRMGSRGRLAHLLDPSAFTAVERRTRNYLHKKRAWLVDETTKRPRKFRPHVTFQGENHLKPGNVFLCDQIYIVEQKGSHKEVVAAVALSRRTNQYRSRP